ncbi:MAG: plasmid pRiA4b ORF-3 family protein [Chloroflexota bacterium]
MLLLARNDIEFTRQQKDLLSTLPITSSSPGTILTDFEICLNYFANNEVFLTPKKQLTLEHLSQLNSVLTNPIKLGLKRPVQKSYPHIHGLYLLCRASMLTREIPHKKKTRLVVVKTVYETWAKLTPFEKYLSLLEIWLLRGRPEILNEWGNTWRQIPDNFGKWTYFFDRIPNEGQAVAGNRDAENWAILLPEAYNFGLLNLFGFLEVSSGSLVDGKGWQINRIARTKIGDAFMALIQTRLFSDYDVYIEIDTQDEISPGTLQPLIDDIFPKWQNFLSIPQPKIQSGTYLFKVSLGKIWRKIAISSEDTLENFATAIINSVDFDHDHLYEFIWHNQYMQSRSATHPYMDRSISTTEVQIKEMRLTVNQNLQFIFDFGDWWEFDILLENIEPETLIGQATIVEEKGESPEQYSIWE